MKSPGIKFKDTLAKPGSELHALLEKGETKKAEDHYRKISKAAEERGEFLKKEKQ